MVGLKGKQLGFFIFVLFSSRLFWQLLVSEAGVKGSGRFSDWFSSLRTWTLETRVAFGLLEGEKCWQLAPPRKISLSLTSWGRKMREPCFLGCTHLKWGFHHTRLGETKEGSMDHDSNATDSCCSYWVLIYFLE